METSKQNEVDQLAKLIWDYHHMNHKLEPADLLLCFTSLDLSVPKYLAELYKHGFAPRILIAGDNAFDPNRTRNIQSTDWDMSEAAKFKQIAIENDVPPEDILIEEKSTNSQQNVELSYELLKSLNLIPHKVILIQKPTMERRAYATFMQFWPDKDIHLIVSSPPFKYEDYVGKVIGRDQIINIMVGDLQRIKIYPSKGFQIYQEIPEKVWNAFEILVNKYNYNKHLVS